MKHSSAASYAARSHDWPASIVARSSGKPPIAPKSPFTFVSERGAPFTVAGLQKMWSDVEFESATLHLRRAKGGATATHPLLGDELRALRALKREAKSPFIFVSERGAPFTVAGLQKMVERAGVEAEDALQGASTHAQTCDGLRAGEQGHRYEDAASLSRPSQHSIDGAVYRACAWPLQRPVALIVRY